MHDRYNMRISRQQQQLLMAWDKQFPVADWERERDRRIAARMGHKNTADGIYTPIPADYPSSLKTKSVVTGVIRGNYNSKVYHLPIGCPSYDTIKQKNIVELSSEAEAQAAGFRKAGNCR